MIVNAANSPEPLKEARKPQYFTIKGMNQSFKEKLTVQCITTL